MNLNSIDLQEKFPEFQPSIIEFAMELQNLILEIFPTVVLTCDEENIGFGFGSDYKDLVFVMSPKREHVNLGIPYGATLADPKGLMQGEGKIHRHVKLHQVEQVQDADLEQLMQMALRTAQERVKKDI